MVLSLSFSTVIFNVIAFSPDYTRQVIIDDPDSSIDDIDWKPEIKDALNSRLLPLDIKSASFVSDGKFLNATIWLFNPLYSGNYDIYIKNNFTFTVFIDLPTTTVPEPVYSMIVSPQGNGTWKKTIAEDEPGILASIPSSPETSNNVSHRVIDTTNNYSGFYRDGERYVNFSIDLAKISYPSKYFVAVQTSIINSTTSAEVLDYTFDYPAPPAENKISYYWEKPVQIRAGSDKSLKLFINSSDLTAKETETFYDANSSSGIEISFSPNPVSVERTGINFTNMLIKADESLYTGSPTTINEIIKIDARTEGNVTVSDSRSISLEILPPISAGEYLVQTNLTYIIPIGVTAVIALWISKKIDRIKNYDSITMETILTVDASVIAGVLIFLTIGSASVFSGVIQKVGVLTASIVFPFAISALRSLITGRVDSFGIKFTVAGFIYLMTSVIVIGFVNS